MVNQVISSAISGLNAAGQRLNVAASNIANAHVVGKTASKLPSEQAYHAKDIQQITDVNGAVKTNIMDRTPPVVIAYDPKSPLRNETGMIDVPNVDIGEELVNLITAESNYKANAKVISTQNDLEKELIDIIS